MIFSTVFYLSLFIITSLMINFINKLSVNNTKEKYIKKILILFTLSIPAFIAGIRYDVGTDYFSYISKFENIAAGNITRSEIGYTILNYIIAFIGGNAHIVFYLSSFISLILVYNFFIKYQQDINIALGIFMYLLLFYNMSLNIVRQSLAMSIIIISFYYIDKKNLWKFLIVVGIAGTFHISALAILPFYFLYNNLGNKSKIFKILIYGLVFSALFFYKDIIEFVSVSILNTSHYIRYASTVEVSIGIGIVLTYTPVLLIGLFFYKKMSRTNKSFQLFYFLLVIGFILKLFPYFGAAFVDRVADYFLMVQAWLIPYYYRILMRRKKTFVISLLLLLFYCAIWFYTYMISEGAGTVPYKTIFW